MPDNKIITDREEMLEAVRNDGNALQYADDILRDDPELKKFDPFLGLY